MAPRRAAGRCCGSSGGVGAGGSVVALPPAVGGLWRVSRASVLVSTSGRVPGRLSRAERRRAGRSVVWTRRAWLPLIVISLGSRSRRAPIEHRGRGGARRALAVGIKARGYK